MKKNKKILIIRLGAIGDVVHSTVIAQSIKQKYPDSVVHFLTQSSIKPLVQLSPYIDEVFDFDMSNKNNLLYLLKLAFQFNRQKYDIIYNLTNSFRNYFVSLLACPKREIIRKKVVKHAVNVFFETGAAGFDDLEMPQKLDLQITEELNNEILEKIKKYPRPYYVFNPGGANDNERQGRIWPLQKWLELGNYITKKNGGTVFVCGSKSEKEYHKVFENIENIVCFSGELSLIQSAALYKQADVMISGDSGPLHIAGALGVNVVALMGATSPALCGPFGVNGYVLEPKTACKYCGLKKCLHLSSGEKITPCMDSISVSDVEKIVNEICFN